MAIAAGRTESAKTPGGRFGPIALLVTLSVGFRWPALLNANTVNADAAIVGLQAMHTLKGELSLFLYGSGYQTSVDSAVAAGFFAILGSSPLALMLSTLMGHVACTLFAYATLARHVRRGAAFVATLPLVFTPSPLHTYILGPPRQAAITLVFASVWLLGGAREDKPRRLAAGAAIAALACFADPYALLFFPALLALAGLRALGGTRGPERRARLVAVFAGAGLGFVPYLLLTSSPRAVHGDVTFTTRTLGHNLALLEERCLPWITSLRAYVPGADGYEAWPSGAFHVVQLTGAAVLGAGIVHGGVALFSSRDARPVRLLGGFGAAVSALTLAGFLVSVMVMDLFSTRYLAAIVLTVPFALAPAAARLPAGRLALVTAPYLLSAAVAGWLGYGDEVRGIVPVHLPGGGAADELALVHELRARGATYGVADYWVSYRLTLLDDEALPVVPIHAAEDRYPPYRAAFDRATTVAYVFDPERSRETLSTMLGEIRDALPYGSPEETIHVGRLTAVVLRRSPVSR